MDYKENFSVLRDWRIVWMRGDGVTQWVESIWRVPDAEGDGGWVSVIWCLPKTKEIYQSPMLYHIDIESSASFLF